MLRSILLLLALLLLAPAPASATTYPFNPADPAFDAIYLTGTKWSTLGVSGSNTPAANTAALNALPVNTPIIGDCPNGNINFSDTWFWKSGLTIWQQPGCRLISTNTTVGVYAIQNFGGFAKTALITNVNYFGFQFSYLTQVSLVRVMLLRVDHMKFKYFDVDNTGGFMFLAGSDIEIAYGSVTNTYHAVGNPGIRLMRTDAGVTLAADMPTGINVWVHDASMDSGDATLQACQPVNNSASWGYAYDTIGVLYQNITAFSAGSSAMLVNEPITFGDGSTYGCSNITFRNITASGYWGAIIWSGNTNTYTHNVGIYDSTYDGSYSTTTLAAFGLGGVTYGGLGATGTDISGIIIDNLVVTNPYYQSLLATSAAPSTAFSGSSITNSTFNAPRTSGGTNFNTAGAPNITLSGNTIH